MFKQWHHITIITAVGLLLTGCYSLGTFQSGRALGKGYEERGFGLTALNTPTVEDTVLSSQFIPSLEIFGGLGIGQKTDLNYRFSGLYGGLELKQQIIGNRKSPFAAALSIGGGSAINFSFYDVYVSTYLSYKPKSFIELTLNPKMTYTFLSGDAERFRIGMAGSNIGILFGHKIQMGITGGFFPVFELSSGVSRTGTSFNLWNVGLGFKIHMLSNYLKR